MNITVLKRKVKNVRIEVKGTDVKVIMPLWANEQVILKKVMPWIKKSVRKQIELQYKAKNLKLHPRSMEKFKEYVFKKVEEYTKDLNVKVTDVKFRKMKRKWGSCSSRGKITINKLCSYLPNELLNYVIFHEVLHRKYMNHGKDFKRIIRNKFPNWRKLDEKLKLYSIKLNSILETTKNN